MEIIPNKYLARDTNWLDSGPSGLLLAQNIRNRNGVIRSRNGQDLLPLEDIAFQALAPGTRQNYLCTKIWFYNNRVWGYFQNTTNNVADIIAYYEPNYAGSNGQWLGNTIIDFGSPGFNYGYGSYPIQLVESNGRLIVSSVLGMYSSPKLDSDPFVDTSTLSTIQTTLRYSGAPAALPMTYVSTASPNDYLINTVATYDANWLGGANKVAYRSVWKYVDARGVEVYGAVSDRKLVTNDTTLLRAVTMRIMLPLFEDAEMARLSCEVYRTEQSVSGANSIIPDPGDEMFFVMELKPTATDVANGYMDFIDIIDDAALQWPLYTNETQEGASSTRVRAPIARTLANFANCCWYGNTKNRIDLPFELVGVRDTAAPAPTAIQGLASNDIIGIGEYCFEGIQGALTLSNGNQFVINNSTGLANTFNRIERTVENIVRNYNNILTRTRFNLNTVTSPNSVGGRMVLQELRDAYVAEGEEPFIGLFRSNGWSSTSGLAPSPITPVPLVSETKGKGVRVTRITASGAGAITFTGSSAPDFAVGDQVYIAAFPSYQDLSLPAGSQGDNTQRFTPGKYEVSFVSGNDFRLSGVNAVGAFNQQIGVAPFATVWNALALAYCVQDEEGFTSQTTSKHEKFVNRVYFSALQEPENAPPLNYIDIGSSDKDIIKLFPLGKFLYVFKEDGLFRIGGSYPDFFVDEYDANCILFATDAICTMGGNIYCLTTKGVYQISESDVTRVSGDIQFDLERIMTGRTQVAKEVSFMVGNEEDQSVTLWLPPTSSLSGDNPTNAWVFDGIGWTQRTDEALYACCGIDANDNTDKYSLYTIKSKGTGWLTKERKTSTAEDFADESFNGTSFVVDGVNLITVTANLKQKNGTSDSTDYAVGGVVIGNGDWSMRARIVGVSPAGANQVQLELQFPAGSSADAYDLVGPLKIYYPITLDWAYGVSSSEDPTTSKHFNSGVIFVQNPLFYSMDVQFSSDVSPSWQQQSDAIEGFIGSYVTVNPNQWNILTPEDGAIMNKTMKFLVNTEKARGSQLNVRFIHTGAIEFVSVYGIGLRSAKGGYNIERRGNA